jgi:hypothetical protein
MMFGQRGACTGGRGQRADTQPAVGISGVAEQQAQNLPAGVAAGAGYRYRGHRDILHHYAQLCKYMLTSPARGT